MKEVEIFVGPCSKYITGQGWTTEVPVEQLKAKGWVKNEEIERLKIDIKNEKNWGKIQTKQARKETAKEILDKCIAIDKATGGKGFVCIEAIAELAKGKGVEVE